MHIKLSRDVVVLNRAGIHARVSTLIYKTVNGFSSAAKLYKGNTCADMRSVLDLLSLGAAQGEKLRLEVEGDDAQATMDAVLALFEARFNEDQL
ncbi:MAG: HPr family phosphocarrier protein [Thermoguttaceae bacterium]